jgi:hypothetical protein
MSKRLVALLLAVAMLVAVGTVAFAAPGKGKGKAFGAKTILDTVTMDVTVTDTLIDCHAIWDYRTQGGAPWDQGDPTTYPEAFEFEIYYDGALYYGATRPGFVEPDKWFQASLTVQMIEFRVRVQERDGKWGQWMWAPTWTAT